MAPSPHLPPFHHWTWTHTILFMAVCIAMAVLVYVLFGVILVILLFIPPIIYLLGSKRVNRK